MSFVTVQAIVGVTLSKVEGSALKTPDRGNSRKTQ
jgi:hypothetical protein